MGDTKQKIIAATLLTSLILGIFLASFDISKAAISQSNIPGGTGLGTNLSGTGNTLPAGSYTDWGDLQNQGMLGGESANTTGGGASLGGISSLFSSGGVKCGGKGGKGGIGGLISGALSSAVSGLVGSIGGLFGSGGGGGLTANEAAATGDMGDFGGSTEGQSQGSGSGPVPVDIQKDSATAPVINKLLQSIQKGQWEPTREEQTLERKNTDELLKKECIIDPFVKAITSMLLRSLTQSIIGWIQGDDAGFVKNLEMSLQSELNQRAGEFLNQLSGINMCGNIGQMLQSSLRGSGGYRNLRPQLECSVSQIVGNVSGFYQNFNNGGWPAFLQTALIPKNNPDGAYLIAMQARDKAIAAKEQEFLETYRAGQGTRGFQTEEKIYFRDASGREGYYTTKSTKTPGQTVMYMLNKSFGTNMDWAVQADEIDEAIEAIIMALINKLLSSSTGDSGEGVFDEGLSNAYQTYRPVKQIEPGGFNDSTVMSQYNAEILRTDSAIKVADARMTQALESIFSNSENIIALQEKIKSLQDQIAGQATSTTSDLQQQLNDAQTALEEAKSGADLKAAKESFDKAIALKENLALVKTEFLKRRYILMTTTDIQTAQALAEERVIISNILDAFLENNLVDVFPVGAPSDVYQSTLQQLDEAINIGSRTLERLDQTTQRLTASSSEAILLEGKKEEMNTSVTELTDFRAAFAALTATQDIQQKAIDAAVKVDQMGYSSVEADKSVAEIIASITQ